MNRLSGLPEPDAGLSGEYYLVLISSSVVGTSYKRPLSDTMGHERGTSMVTALLIF